MYGILQSTQLRSGNSIHEIIVEISNIIYATLLHEDVS